VLAILDGWGCSGETYGNAIAAAKLPAWSGLLERYPWTTVAAAGEDVGLPKGIMGNSEVGHLNIGSGRVVPQGVVVINEEIAAGTFGANPVLRQCLAHVDQQRSRLHLMGLLSDGCVHSSFDHLEALIDAAAAAGAPLAVHAFGDGRDVPPKSMLAFTDRLERALAARGRAGAVATVSGRFYAMDRDKRWERVARAYDALANGKAEHRAESARAAVEAAYERGETDEFIVPTIVGEPRPVEDGDAVIFFNFRPDRARELTLAFSGPKFAEFPARAYERLLFATMTRYEEYFPNPVLFGPRPQFDTLGDAVSRAGLRQLRLAETEKYAHVTYFFNGGREEELPGEDRLLVPSDRTVATYDLAPAMRASEITDAALRDLASAGHDVIVLNYANADMVGHTGNFAATVAAVEILDREIARLSEAVLARGGTLAITADHGNAEEKIAPGGEPLTAHTTNRVPFVVIANDPPEGLAPGGRLGDVAPTILALLGIPAPPAMTGRDLSASAAALSRRSA
jgi:2,3-bisphosphoglycerate-independent phosphoglycerate mutase